MGYLYQERSIFADNGIWAYTAPRDRGEGTTIIDQSVFLYELHSRWEARITQHGGKHWACTASSVEALEVVAIRALQATQLPPSDEWLPL
jgi:hypothetical protein